MSKKLLIISIAVILCLAATAIVLYKVLVPQPELTEDQALAIALEQDPHALLIALPEEF
jgi:flagellar basal body-associated protein FliL